MHCHRIKLNIFKVQHKKMWHFNIIVVYRTFSSQHLVWYLAWCVEHWGRHEYSKVFQKKKKKESLNLSDTVLEVTTDHLSSSAIWRTKEKVPRVAEFYRHCCTKVCGGKPTALPECVCDRTWAPLCLPCVSERKLQSPRSDPPPSRSSPLNCVNPETLWREHNEVWARTVKSKVKDRQCEHIFALYF